MADTGRKRTLDSDIRGYFPQKKLKLSDLPISQTKRSAIDGLVNTFRKKGEYDAMRKTLFAQFETNVSALSTSGSWLCCCTANMPLSGRQSCPPQITGGAG